MSLGGLEQAELPCPLGRRVPVLHAEFAVQRRLEKACALARAGDVNTDHYLAAAMHYANLLAVVGRLDDAAAQVADGTEQARREGNAMALDMWGRSRRG